MESDKIIRIIKREGLRPASKRDLPLFTISCIALGYTKILKDEAGFSYESIAGMATGSICNFMFNENHVANEIKKFLKRNDGKLDDHMLSSMDKSFVQIKQQLKEIKRLGPMDFLKSIIDIYPHYFSSIGYYNCFSRYLGNEYRLDGNFVNRIADKREAMARLYPEIEQLIKSNARSIGKDDRFDGDLLRYLTLSEMRRFLTNKVMSSKTLFKLEQRRRRCFYLCVEDKNKEYIISDENNIKDIYNHFFKIDTSIEELKGHTAFPGVLRGIVCKSYDKKVANCVLVTSMTHPKDIAVIKQSSAIVTDEGGILSHAAIIAREMKIPCIIGTKHATQVFKDGDLVEVDANKGIVRKIKQ